MNVLVAAAHMDDETLGMGGTIAKHVHAGDSVTVWIAAKRAYDHQFDPRIIEEERAAALKAAKVLGHKARFQDLPDELLDQKLLDLIVPLERCVQEVQPQAVYTHHRWDVNQDHRAVFEATLVACRPIARHKVSRLLCYEVPSSTDQVPPSADGAFLPNYYVDIQRFLERKQEALRAYARELREFPHPRSLKGIEVLAHKRGMEVGLPAAEAFMVLRDQWE